MTSFPADVLHQVRVPIDGSRSYVLSYQPPPPPPRPNHGNTNSGISVRVSGDGGGNGSSQLVNMHSSDNSGMNSALDCSGGQMNDGIFTDNLGYYFALSGCINGNPDISGSVARVIVGRFRDGTATNAADFSPVKPLTPGEIITIFGNELAGQTATSSTPVSVLGGTKVTATDDEGNESDLGLAPRSPRRSQRRRAEARRDGGSRMTRRVIGLTRVPQRGRLTLRGWPC